MGRCALVTGSTAGIGLATAEALAAMGADIVMNGLGDYKANVSLSLSLSERHSVRVAYSNADVSHLEGVKALVKTAKEHGGGKLDILVNNAGFSYVDVPVEALEEKIWEKQLALNLTAPLNAIRCALPGMRARAWGRIVNVASVLGLVAVPNRAGYVATKHALVGLTKVVALETADTPITCNAVCPGLVGTERVLDKHRQDAALTSRSVDDVQREVMAARQPSGQYIRTVDVAAAIAYLCGPHADEMRGALWTIDGGWCAR